MTQKGMAGKAVGAAVLCSAIGDCLYPGHDERDRAPGAVGHYEYWSTRNLCASIFGLAVASSVGGRTIWKGWLSVLLGLIIATIGQDPVGGINRYNFGFDLAAGIAFVPAILGFFAVSEIFVQAEKKGWGHL